MRQRPKQASYASKYDSRFQNISDVPQGIKPFEDFRRITKSEGNDGVQAAERSRKERVSEISISHDDSDLRKHPSERHNSNVSKQKGPKNIPNRTNDVPKKDTRSQKIPGNVGGKMIQFLSLDDIPDDMDILSPSKKISGQQSADMNSGVVAARNHGHSYQISNDRSPPKAIVRDQITNYRSPPEPMMRDQITNDRSPPQVIRRENIVERGVMLRPMKPASPNDEFISRRKEIDNVHTTKTPPVTTSAFPVSVPRNSLPKGVIPHHTHIDENWFEDDVEDEINADHKPNHGYSHKKDHHIENEWSKDDISEMDSQLEYFEHKSNRSPTTNKQLNNKPPLALPELPALAKPVVRDKDKKIPPGDELHYSKNPRPVNFKYVP